MKDASQTQVIKEGWLPKGKLAAVVMTIDDIHPGQRERDGYDGGGDLEAGALGLVHELIRRHPELWVTLFTTPDWRETTPHVTKRWVNRVPGLRDRVHLTKLRPKGAMRLDRHPEFVAYLRTMPQVEVGLHGLHHIHPGRTVLVEFQDQNAHTCGRILRKGLKIFEDAGLPRPTGFTPPGWRAPQGLIDAMSALGFDYLASSRDIFTPITPEAVSQMSGLKGVSLLYPEWIARGSLVHMSSNFQATSPMSRAFDIVEAGGILAIKAHIVKSAFGHVALDGVDALYMNYLDALFANLKARYGDTLHWTSMQEIAERLQSQRKAHLEVA